MRLRTDLASLDKSFCVQKIDSAIGLVDRLLDGEHPHDDSKLALQQLRAVYERDKQLLLSQDDSIANDTLLEFCRRANVNLVRLKVFVGFLLRSTNIRNAFEFYFPIRLLASELIGKKAPVVLGSEWNFSPYTYPAALDELPDFIFIGIPASECQNPLILPLAGHELGHVIWRRKGGQKKFDPKIRITVLDLYRANWDEFKKYFGATADINQIDSDLFLQRIWAKSFELARSQLEELFCDSVGVYVFGQSFLHSFRYLLAPSLGQFRSVAYPRIRSRAKYMHAYAISLGMNAIAGFEESFSDSDQTFSQSDAFMLKMADEAVDKLHTDLPNLVEKYHGVAEKFTTGRGEEEGARVCLRALIPPSTVRSVAAIVNAAWDIRLTIDEWGILTNVENADQRRIEKQRILTDLVLKTFEVYEFQKRTTPNAP